MFDIGFLQEFMLNIQIMGLICNIQFNTLIFMNRSITKLSFLGACFKSGQPISGVQLGPKCIRDSGIFKALSNNYGIHVNDRGDVQEITGNKRFQTHINNLHILDPSLKKLNDKVYDIVKNINDKEEILVTAGGDHSIATGTIHGLLGKYPDLKVIWVDAHGDLADVGRSQYPGYHGMPFAHLLGINDGKIPGFQWMTKRLKPENCVHIGIRDVDPDEWQTIQNLSKLGMKFFTPDHIDKFGIGQVMRQTLEHLDPKNSQAPIHISFDIDGIDPTICQGTGTKYRGGLNHREGCHIIRRSVWQRKVVSMDLVQINPALQKKTRNNYRGQQKFKQNLSETVGMGIDLMDSLFRRTISNIY